MTSLQVVNPFAVGFLLARDVTNWWRHSISRFPDTITLVVYPPHTLVRLLAASSRPPWHSQTLIFHDQQIEYRRLSVSVDCSTRYPNDKTVVQLVRNGVIQCETFAIFTMKSNVRCGTSENVLLCWFAKKRHDSWHLATTRGEHCASRVLLPFFLSLVKRHKKWRHSRTVLTVNYAL